MVVLGRPKGPRDSYKHWEEGDLAPQVVFEIVSRNDSFKKMLSKFYFYQQYGIEEYYLYDELRENELSGWIRKGDLLQPLEEMQGWVSPRLGIHFGVGAQGLLLLHPDGQPFESFVETPARQEALAKENQDLIRERDLLAEKLRQLGFDPAAL
jgi:hypothetical protein